MTEEQIAHELSFVLEQITLGLSLNVVGVTAEDGLDAVFSFERYGHRVKVAHAVDITMDDMVKEARDIARKALVALGVL